MLTNLELSAIDVPHIDQYFGLWAIHEDRFRAMVDRVNSIDIRAHVTEGTRAEAQASHGLRGEGFDIVDGIAVIELTGTLMKFVGSLSGGTSTVHVRRMIRAAANDDQVSAIMLRIDSPGGTVAGTKDTADEVRAANQRKPVYAFIEDLGASAAYIIASQASRIFATQTTLIGSIGTFAVLQDLTGAAAQQGIKVHVIRAGDFKGAGVPGTEITPDHLAETQRLVTEVNDFFLNDIATGRKLSAAAVRELADGRVHLAAKATANGLIDGVQTFEQTLAQLAAKVSSTGTRSGNPKSTIRNPQSKKEDTMSNENESTTQTLTSETAVANLTDLKSALPDADAGFYVKCLEKDMTVAQAKDAWMDRLTAQNQAQAKEIELAKAKKEAPGVDPLNHDAAGESEATGGGAGDRWKEAISNKVKSGMSRSEAAAAVNREDPQLREDYVSEVNIAQGRARAVA